MSALSPTKLAARKRNGPRAEVPLPAPRPVHGGQALAPSHCLQPPSIFLIHPSMGSNLGQKDLSDLGQAWPISRQCE